MARLQYRSAFAVHALLLFAAGGVARAEETAPAANALPGSEIPPGLGLSPQAPAVPPAPGGRAPSFGAPSDKDSPTFTLGGRFYGYEALGIGHKPGSAFPGYSGVPLHTQPIFAGKLPYWGGAGATLNATFGTPTLSAFATYYFRANGHERQGYYDPGLGPGFGSAYVLYTPDAINGLHLKFKVGALIENYGGPGQWGWGIFGPMAALRGYGETASADWDVTRDLHLTLTHGVLVSPGVDEDYPRGNANSWLETGISSWLHHAHVKLDWQQTTHFLLHYISAHGVDERTHLPNSLRTNDHSDGRMDTYLAEFGWDANPWGHVGATAGLYDFKKAWSIGDGIWWAENYTKGAGDMINKYLGANSNGTGKVAVVGFEWDFNVASLLWYPRSFTGNAPGLDVRVAGMMTRTVETQDPLFKNANGYFFGLESDYKFSKYFFLTFKTYGESRQANLNVTYLDPNDLDAYNLPKAHLRTVNRRFDVYSINPGIAFHSNWMSQDRIEIIYSRRFYSSAADFNSAKPLDHHSIVVGGYVTF
jgi:hypothetical protein